MRPFRSIALLVAAVPALAFAQGASPAQPPAAPGPDATAPASPSPAEPPERQRTERDAPAVPQSIPEAAPATPSAPAVTGEGDADSAPASEPSSVQAPAATPTTDAPVLDTGEAPRTTDAQQQRLVNGAPLYNPNVNVHIVQKKRFADEGKHELVLYPGVVQVNGKFTNHVGTGLNYVYHLQENFALQVGGQYNWYSDESDFNLELIDKVREQAQAASSLLLQWGAYAGVEVTPLYGKFAFFNNSLAQFSVVLSGGAGIGKTRHLIRPEVANEVEGQTFQVPARFGDTGNKFLGEVGGGFRVQFGEHYALRLEVRDLIYTARVDKVDGCNLADFEALEAARAANQPFDGLSLSGSCKVAKFDGVDPKTKKNYREDIILGRDLVAEPSSDVLNNVSFYAGFSVLF
ncbi:outer membrane beta-barrel domain-containing protein [Corallococcus exiguus]|uniref:outer membrane beta-barrel domain-containing protein n=1 Tax=Corallococcus TaxID=83461 RepID=UPI000EA30417|nr:MULTISPECIES: outer membrane beta-barrel domain-containing protein [Corallococcus]NNC19927.1 outer membrane beta-barrel domain-containing protein [Corallococcus exiguus]NRD58370.1 outer membrane beta-barrel domain-containing protein [Corallococcus exiguus]NRD63901.1 outer membrane beta-barrel domain-containing protein [Corallococcus exiguus]RKH21442.1 outer membrane beta-barrel domain-containing protein [Corallococcus sp. CA041A]RKI09011.1 outer membrane beta-barrel domain-containing protei